MRWYVDTQEATAALDLVDVLVDELGTASLMAYQAEREHPGRLHVAQREIKLAAHFLGAMASHHPLNLEDTAIRWGLIEVWRSIALAQVTAASAMSDEKARAKALQEHHENAHKMMERLRALVVGDW